MSELTMTKNQRANFLAELHVGVLTIEREGAAPLAAPVWYSYEPGGDVVFSFEATSEKLDLTHRAGTASLCVQNETMPYQYVTVEGPMTVGDDRPRHRARLAYRYLGQEIGDIYLEAVADTGVEWFRLSPTRWRTVDYSAMVDRLLGRTRPVTFAVTATRYQPPGRCSGDGKPTSMAAMTIDSISTAQGSAVDRPRYSRTPGATPTPSCSRLGPE